MKHSHRYADFSTAFDDRDYVERRQSEILGRATPGANGCLELSGSLTGKGYVQVGFAGTRWLAHRLIYMFEHGDIGHLVIDHKCRNRRCGNIAHLEAVSNKENVQRGKDASHGGKCGAGHDMVQIKVRERTFLGCRICRNAKRRAEYAAAKGG